MANKTSKKSAKVAPPKSKKASVKPVVAKPKLLAGGNPQISAELRRRELCRYRENRRYAK